MIHSTPKMIKPISYHQEKTNIINVESILANLKNDSIVSYNTNQLLG